MKISKNQLLRIIKEELQSVLKEALAVPPPEFRDSDVEPSSVSVEDLRLDAAALKKLLGTLRTDAAVGAVMRILAGMSSEEMSEFPPKVPSDREEPDVFTGGGAATRYTENQKRNKRNK